MALTHHINHVRFRDGLDGREDGITEVRVANQVGMLDFPIEEVITRIQHGESFDTWMLDTAADTVVQEDVRLVTDSHGHTYLHVTESSLVELPRF